MEMNNVVSHEPASHEPASHEPASHEPASHKPKNKHECKWCYSKDSKDARCCGACYLCCPTKPNENACVICPNDLSEYCNSGYILTDDGTSSKQTDGLCCVLCCPLKISLFFSCFLGSMCNGCINCIQI